MVSLRVPTIWIDGLTVYEGGVGESADALFAARLACSYHEQVSGSVWTSDVTALAGEDYLSVNDTIVLPAGEVEVLVPVTVLGDDVDEDHEHFDLNLSLDPGDAVQPFGPASGLIYNDDFCAQPPGFWESNPEMWMVDSLEIGGVEYDSATLLWLLSYRGSDISHELARELVAAKLNLAVGSDPSILPTVDAADDFLSRFPPGSQPSGHAKQEGRELVDMLLTYNDSGCPLAMRTGGTRLYCDACGG
jgi:hypothetical protein